MVDTPNLGLPEIAADQAMKHITHNEALAVLDAIVQLTAKSRSALEPPPSPEPVDGDRYLIPSGVSPEPSGDFEDEGGKVASLQDGVWQFRTPKIGWIAYVEDEDVVVRYDGSAWVDLLPAAQVNSIAGIETGTFTPTFTFVTPGTLSVTYTTQAGYYYRLGKAYFFQFRLAFSLNAYTGASGNARVLLGTLPAPIGGITRQSVSLGSTANVVFDATKRHFGAMTQNTNAFQMYAQAPSAMPTNWSTTEFPASASSVAIEGGGWYLAN